MLQNWIWCNFSYFDIKNRQNCEFMLLVRFPFDFRSISVRFPLDFRSPFPQICVFWLFLNDLRKYFRSIFARFPLCLRFWELVDFRVFARKKAGNHSKSWKACEKYKFNTQMPILLEKGQNCQWIFDLCTDVRIPNNLRRILWFVMSLRRICLSEWLCTKVWHMGCWSPAQHVPATSRTKHLANTRKH